MPPTISPGMIGASSYTVSGSRNAWYYLDIDLQFGEEANLELHCPTAATVTLTEADTVPITITLLTAGTTPTNSTPVRTVDCSAGPGGGGVILFVTIAALNSFHTPWLLQVGGVASGQSVTFEVTLGDAQIVRILADPVATAPALAPLKEKTPISLTGTADYMTVPTGGGPMGTPAPPTLRARWTQVGPAAISAAPPNTVFSAPPAPTPLNAKIAPSAAFRSPGVYADQQIQYRLTAFYDHIPNSVADPTEPTAEADVTLTVQPRTQHMLLVVDRSGSMLAPVPGTSLTRWELARRAAHVWADLWMGLRGGVSAADKAGIMIYEAANCGWTGTKATPIDILLPANGNLGGINDLDTPSLDLGQPGSCTPIGDALINAIDRFVDVKGTPDDRYVLFQATDGEENSGTIVVEDDSPTPPGATDTFDHQRGAGPRGAVNAQLAIYTIGMGPRGTVQENVLHDLTDGPSERGLYKLVQADQLMATLGEMLGHALEAQPATPKDPNSPFDVAANEHRLLIALQCDNADDRMKVFRRAGAGTEEQVAGPGSIATNGVTENQRGSHGMVAVDLVSHFSGEVPATTWRVEYLEHGIEQDPPKTIAPGRLLVMVDLFVTADVRFDRRRYATGQRALVTCQLAAGGEPIRGARVDVELARPGEGLGTFLASNGSGYKPSGPSGPDPLAPKGAMLAELLRRKDQKELSTTHPSGIFRDGTDQLWDDGQHRDGVPDDGTYANTYAGLDKEGTYDWRFTISGTTPDGDPFFRVLTRAFWVGVGVDPGATKIDVRPVKSGEENLQAVQITVTPVDRFGELLGPFRASEVVIRSKIGQFNQFKNPQDGIAYPQPDKGDLLSHYDGRYSRLLTYKAGEQPVVKLAIQGRPFPDIVVP